MDLSKESVNEPLRFREIIWDSSNPSSKKNIRRDSSDGQFEGVASPVLSPRQKKESLPVNRHAKLSRPMSYSSGTTSNTPKFPFPTPSDTPSAESSQHGIGSGHQAGQRYYERNRLPSNSPATPDYSRTPSLQLSASVQHRLPIHFTYNAAAERHYDEPLNDDHESDFWKKYAKKPLQALSHLHLRVRFFPHVTVEGRRPPPQTSYTKPSVAVILYILVAAGGPLSVSTAQRALYAYHKEYKNQTIRKAFCKGDTFVQTTDKKAWTIPKLKDFKPRLKALGERNTAGKKRKIDEMASGYEADESSSSTDDRVEGIADSSVLSSSRTSTLAEPSQSMHDSALLKTASSVSAAKETSKNYSTATERRPSSETVPCDARTTSNQFLEDNVEASVESDSSTDGLSDNSMGCISQIRAPAGQMLRLADNVTPPQTQHGSHTAPTSKTSTGHLSSEDGSSGSPVARVPQINYDQMLIPAASFPAADVQTKILDNSLQGFTFAAPLPLRALIAGLLQMPPRQVDKRMRLSFICN